MELDISVDTEELIKKAPNWNLSGDCAILELMKRISENMDERANHTFDAMEKLDLSVRRTELALETTNNSLRALHFGQQYVEYRVQEEDDEVAYSMDNKPKIKSKRKPHKSKEEILDEVLANNIRVFRENFEKVEIEIPDSDDEDGNVTTTCMYRAKNHLDKPLPYLIGTKEWNQHWHVGTIEDVNEYSGDEESEEFSETSSSSEENEAVREESYDSANVTNVSDWASSSSLNIDKTKSTQRSDFNPQSMLAKQIVSATASKIIGATVSTSSSNTSLDKSQSRNIQIERQRHPHEHDLFAALRQSPPSDDIPTVSSSSTSSSNVLNRSPHIVQQFPPSTYVNKKPPTEIKVQHNLFDEDDDVMPTRNTQQQTLPEDDKVNTPVNNQIKRKPVNLFDDNEFNSFLSEITNKAHARGESNSNAPSPSGLKNQIGNQERTNSNQQTVKVPEKQISSFSLPAIDQTNRRQPVNLFDDDNDDDGVLKSFSSAIADKVPSKVVTTTGTKYQNEITTTTPTSKPLHNTKPSAQLSNNNVTNSTIPIPTPRKELPKKTVNLFDDSPPPSPVQSKNATTERRYDELKGRLTTASLFAANPDDDDDDFLGSFGSINKPLDKSKGAIGKSSGINTNQPKVKGTISLFSDDDDDELDINNIFSRKTEPRRVLADPKTSTSVVSLFDDDGDDDDKDLFGNKKAIKAALPTDAKTQNTKVPVHNAQIENKANLPLENATLSKQELPIKPSKVDLFAEEIKQEENQAKVSLENASLIQSDLPAKGDLFTKEIKQDLPIKKPSKVDLFAEEETIHSEHKQNNKKPGEISSTLTDDTAVSEKGNTEENKNVPTLVEDSISKEVIEKTDNTEQLSSFDKDEDKDLFSNTSLSKSLKSSDELKTEETLKSTVDKAPMNKTEELQGSKQNTPAKINIFNDVKVFDDNDDDDDLFPTSIKSSRLNSEDWKPADKADFISNKNDMTRRLDKKIETEIVDNFEKELNVETSSVQQQGLSDSLTNLVVANTPEKMRSAALASDLNSPAKPNQTYNSLFMDEPPDDSEFFQTLGSSKMSSSKIFDLEQDFYEPSLPDIPNIPKAVTTTGTGSESTQAISSDYDGLRLFSEIPPDDDHHNDDDNDNGNRNIKTTVTESPNSRVESIGSNTKRLHTIFYDDFSETPTSSSVGKGLTKEPTSIFNDEPPPDIETKNARDVDVVDRSEAQNLEKNALAKREPVSVGKLVKPTININVKALLPSTGAIPKIKKNHAPVIEKKYPDVDAILPTGTAVTPVQIREQSSSRESTPSSSNQNLLSCMNKQRVRVPVKRRPSTRQARQENYRKSLLDEAHTERDDIDGKEVVAVELPKEQTTKEATRQNISKTQPKMKTFLDSDDDEVPFINTPPKALSITTTNTANKPLAVSKATNAKPTAPVANFRPYAGMQSSALATKTYKSFLDTDDDDEDDLFAQIDKTPITKSTEQPLNEAQKTSRQQAKSNPVQKVKTSLFSSDDDDDDDNSGFLSSLKRTPKTIPKTTATTTSKGLFSDVDSDDGDDLFGSGRHSSKTQHSKQTRIGDKEGSRSTSKAVKKPQQATASDNPLADLLNP